MVTVYFPLNATCPQSNFEDYAQVLRNQEFYSDKWDDIVFRLGFCGAKAVPLLKETLDVLNRLTASYNSSIEYGDKRWYIIKALGQIGEDAKDAVPELTAILEDEKSGDYLQYLTVNAIGKIGLKAKSAIPSLRKLLESAESEN